MSQCTHSHPEHGPCVRDAGHVGAHWDVGEDLGPALGGSSGRATRCHVWFTAELPAVDLRPEQGEQSV